MSSQHSSAALLTSTSAKRHCHIFAMRAGNCPSPSTPAGQAHAHVHKGGHRPRKRSHGGSRCKGGVGKKPQEAK